MRSIREGVGPVCCESLSCLLLLLNGPALFLENKRKILAIGGGTLVECSTHWKVRGFEEQFNVSDRWIRNANELFEGDHGLVDASKLQTMITLCCEIGRWNRARTDRSTRNSAGSLISASAKPSRKAIFTIPLTVVP